MTDRLQAEARRTASQAMADDLSDFIVAAGYDALPQTGVGFTKALITKIVAGMVGGAQSPSARALAEIIRERAGAEEATAIGFGFRTGLWDVAMLNVFTGHTSELEDVGHSPAGVSWDITIIPSTIALAEKLHLSGRELLEAIAVGLEVHYRTCMPFDATAAGMILPPTAAMGCAAAASKAYGSTAGQTKAALGISLSCVPMTEVNMGTDAHFFESALHGLQGVAAAELAQAGFTSNPDIASFQGLGAHSVPLELVTEGLMDKWYFEELWIKKYPLCFLVHRQVDALLEILAGENIGYDDIAEVEVVSGPGGTSCDRAEVRTIGDLQFSFQHALGVAMRKGRIDLADVEIEAATDPGYRDARGKVSVVIDESLPFSVALADPTSVAVTTKDGRTLSRQRTSAKGSPDDPLSQQELSDLYRQFARGGMEPPAVERSLELIWNLEELDDVGELIDALAPQLPTHESDQNGKDR